MAEQVFLKKEEIEFGDIIVTSARIVRDGKTFIVNNMTSVQKRKTGRCFIIGPIAYVATIEMTDGRRVDVSYNQEEMAVDDVINAINQAIAAHG